MSAKKEGQFNVANRSTFVNSPRQARPKSKQSSTVTVPIMFCQSTQHMILFGWLATKGGSTWRPIPRRKLFLDVEFLRRVAYIIFRFEAIFNRNVRSNGLIQPGQLRLARKHSFHPVKRLGQLGPKKMPLGGRSGQQCACISNVSTECLRK